MHSEDLTGQVTSPGVCRQAANGTKDDRQEKDAQRYHAIISPAIAGFENIPCQLAQCKALRLRIGRCQGQGILQLGGTGYVSFLVSAESVQHLGRLVSLL